MHTVTKGPAEGQAQSHARETMLPSPPEQPPTPTDPAPDWKYPLHHRLSDMEGSLLGICSELGDLLCAALDATEDEPSMSIKGSRGVIEEAAANVLVNVSALCREVTEIRRELRDRKIL